MKLHLTNSWCRSNEKKLFVPGLAPIRGDYRLIGTMFPMHAFLCSLGLKFDDLKSILNKYEQDHFSTYNTIIYTLGVNCAGRYFACYCSANAISTDPFPAVDLLPKKKDRVNWFHPFSGRNPSSGRQPDNMPANLHERPRRLRLSSRRSHDLHRSGDWRLLRQAEGDQATVRRGVALATNIARTLPGGA